MKANILEEMEKTLVQLNATPMGRRLFLANIGLLMTSCASSQHRYREGNLKGDETSLSVEEERKMTQEALPEMQKEYPALNDSESQNYVSHLGQKIVSANGLAGNPYRYTFTVVDVGYVNAFALPAGTVFVTQPLIAMADSEAELAGVIGHEIGHIKARHTAQRMEKAKKEQTRSILFGVGGGLLGGAAGFGLGKLMCKKEDNACLAKAAALGAAAGAGGGLLIQKFAFMANSQEDEMEADRIGFRTATKAGYDKNAVGLFYSKLLRMEEQHKQKQVPLLSSVTDAISTHPPSKERVSQMEQMAREYNGSSGIVSTNDFQRIRAKASQRTASGSNKT